ncbi:MAG: glycosyl hydrolase [Acidobacteriota bacterium]
MMVNRKVHPSWCAFILFTLLLTLAVQTVAQQPAATTEKPTETKAFERLEWRSIGPSNMGGRVSDVEGVPGNPNLVYVGAASGGVWKTTNGGMTWTAIFDKQGSQSIGDIALEPNNPDVIWVGTGESNVRNSVGFGDGIYKSVDGGKSWKYLGLKDTNAISRVLVHPTNPDIVYVAALGHTFGGNEERGVFMTTDGGATWKKTLYIDANHGASDIEIDPANPNILYAGMWYFERKPWTFKSGSEKGGLYRSLDGGRTWNKITNGLPKLIGRIGVRVAPSSPNIVYAIVESKDGALYRSDDKGENFRQVYKNSNIVQRGFYYTRVRVDPTNENKVYAVSSPLYRSIDGGKTFQMISPRTHIDYHALWIDPKNPNYMWQGQDGGVAVTTDGNTWAYINNFPIGQFYQVYADNRQPFYWLSGGLQDNGTWTGPSRTREPAGILNDDWRMVSFGDGFYALNHPDDPELYLTESQAGNVVRTDMRNREQQSIDPYAGNGGGAAENNKYRFNWNSPLVASPHNKNTVYIASNVVFKSTDYGKSWTKISDDLTTNNKERQKVAGGPIAEENSSAEYFCTIISLAESPKQAGMIWVGTDDGNLQLTTDGGKSWTNLAKNVPGIPVDSSISHVEPSRVNSNTAYVAYDRHKFDDYRPYVFKTTDGGKSFTNISAGLPTNAYVHALCEDPKNPGLIYAGTEIGLFASYTGGGNWINLGLKNFPNVAVHDIVVHPRDNDLIVATHGRSFWVFDDATPLQQMNANVLASDATLFDVRPGIRFTRRFTRYGIGDAVFTGANPPSGALIYYYLKDKPDDKNPLKVEIFDANGKLVREIKNASKNPGVNRAVWDLSYEGPKLRRPIPEEQLQFLGSLSGPQVMPGTYTVKLTLGSKTQEKKIAVRIDPTVKVTVEDLQTQFDLAMKVQNMVSPLNEGLRALDSYKAQLEQIEKTVKDRLPDAPADLTKALTDYKKQVEDLANSIAQAEGGGIGGTPKLADNLFGMMFTVSGGNFAPTAAQREYIAELSSEFPKKMEEINKFINETVPKMNETLKKYNAPTLISGKPIVVSQ